MSFFCVLLAGGLAVAIFQGVLLGRHAAPRRLAWQGGTKEKRKDIGGGEPLRGPGARRGKARTRRPSGRRRRVHRELPRASRPPPTQRQLAGGHAPQLPKGAGVLRGGPAKGRNNGKTTRVKAAWAGLGLCCPRHRNTWTWSPRRRPKPGGRVLTV